jgi:hypothetical protein
MATSWAGSGLKVNVLHQEAIATDNIRTQRQRNLRSFLACRYETVLS